jgi:hypothetical protein
MIYRLMQDYYAVFDWKARSRIKVPDMHYVSLGFDENKAYSMCIFKSLIFSQPPSFVFEHLSEETGEKEVAFYIYIEDFCEEARLWIDAHLSLAEEFGNVFCENRNTTMKECDFHEDEYCINSDDENSFLDLSTDEKDYIKRLKFLAAADMIQKKKLLDKARSQGDIDGIALYSFAIARSMSQFCATNSVKDGTSINTGRGKGGEATADRNGYRQLLNYYKLLYPKKSRQKLWDIICRDLRKKPFYTPCGEYEIQLWIDPVHDNHQLAQLKDGKSNREVRFRTFRSKEFFDM